MAEWEGTPDPGSGGQLGGLGKVTRPPRELVTAIYRTLQTGSYCFHFTDKETEAQKVSN